MTNMWSKEQKEEFNDIIARSLFLGLQEVDIEGFKFKMEDNVVKLIGGVMDEYNHNLVLPSLPEECLLNLYKVDYKEDNIDYSLYLSDGTKRLYEDNISADVFVSVYGENVNSVDSYSLRNMCHLRDVYFPNCNSFDFSIEGLSFSLNLHLKDFEGKVSELYDIKCGCQDTQYFIEKDDDVGNCDEVEDVKWNYFIHIFKDNIKKSISYFVKKWGV